MIKLTNDRPTQEAVPRPHLFYRPTCGGVQKIIFKHHSLPSKGKQETLQPIELLILKTIKNEGIRSEVYHPTTGRICRRAYY